MVTKRIKDALNLISWELRQELTHYTNEETPVFSSLGILGSTTQIKPVQSKTKSGNEETVKVQLTLDLREKDGAVISEEENRTIDLIFGLLNYRGNNSKIRDEVSCLKLTNLNVYRSRCRNNNDNSTYSRTIFELTIVNMRPIKKIVTPNLDNLISQT